MRSGSFRYLLKEGVKGIFTHKLMSLASIGVLVACLVLIGCASLFAANINNAVGQIENQNQMVIFCNDDATQEEMDVLGERLSSTEGVASISFVSKEEALQQQKETMGEAGELLDEYADETWLPASYVVTLRDVSDMSRLTTIFQEYDSVQKVRAPQEFADTIIGIKNIVTAVGYGMVSILVLVALVIIANTIRLTVFARRREVNIMKYVGATNTFIRLPFIVEGILIGLIASVLSFGILWAGYYGVGSWLAGGLLSSFGGASVLMPFGRVALYLGAGFVLIGVFTGAVGSAFALRKHLKV